MRSFGVMLLAGGLLLAAGCDPVKNDGGDDDGNAADAAPTSDAEPPADGFICESGAFLHCQDELAVFCNDSGDGTNPQECSYGCDDDSAGCNQCAPSQLLCSGNILTECTADGTVGNSVEDCTGPCIENDAASGPAHCAVTTPRFVAADMCEQAAMVDTLQIGGGSTLITSLPANCHYIVSPGPSLPEICVLRVRQYEILNGGLHKFLGNRAVAIIATDDILIDGTLDASGDGTTPGPGAVSGPGPGFATTNTLVGTGGGGHATDGAAGGQGLLAGNGTIGGDSYDLSDDETVLQTGSPGGQNMFGGATTINGGGGGGGVLLVSCTGEVRIGGGVNAGGGGGAGGAGGGPAVSARAGTGGGSGGRIHIQALQVTVDGVLAANGGGGGAGGQSAASGTGTAGGSGGDGGLSTNPAAGGMNIANGPGAGGIGGTQAFSPGAGNGATITTLHGTGGGGGAMGRIQIDLPEGQSPTIGAGAVISPAASGTTLQVH